jgi:hypothetical protein
MPWIECETPVLEKREGVLLFLRFKDCRHLTAPNHTT